MHTNTQSNVRAYEARNSQSRGRNFCAKYHTHIHNGCSAQIPTIHLTHRSSYGVRCTVYDLRQPIKISSKRSLLIFIFVSLTLQMVSSWIGLVTEWTLKTILRLGSLSFTCALLISTFVVFVKKILFIIYCFVVGISQWILRFKIYSTIFNFFIWCFGIQSSTLGAHNNTQCDPIEYGVYLDNRFFELSW